MTARLIGSSQGFGLLETMIGLTLASLLISLLLGPYLLSKKHTTKMVGLLEEQLDLQLVEALIRDEVRQAGFTPCMNVESLVTQTVNSPALKAVEWTHPFALQLYSMSPYFQSHVEIISLNTIKIPLGVKFHAHEQILLADCYHAEVKTIAQIDTDLKSMRLVFTTALAFSYLSPVYIGEWLHTRIYLRKNTQHEQRLYYGQSHAEELSAAVKDFSGTRHQQMVRIGLGLVSGEDAFIDTVVRSR